MQQEYDVIIVGAGPAGIICAYLLKDKGLKVAIIEKSIFPKDKTCGDALSIDVVNQLQLIDPSLGQAFELLAEKIPSYGITVVSPAGHAIEMPLYKDSNDKRSGYVCKRVVFDNFLYEQLKKSDQVDFYLDTVVVDVDCTAENAAVHTTKGSFTTKMLIGADGAHSIVKKKMIGQAIAKEHYSAGLRQYFKNVKNFNSENFIELHFFKEILPGYLWVFPLPNNEANVGIGIPSSTISKKEIDLKKVFQQLIKEHPSLKERFKDAIPMESIKGYGLPLGSQKNKLSGERFLLLGDAASLIDPFSGEGIANAIRSGRIAADVITAAISGNNFSASFLHSYDKEIYRRMWLEFNVSRQMQKLSRFARAFDFIAGRVQNSNYLKDFMRDALASVHKKKVLIGPKFLYHLFLKK
ncbi:MAG: geranylgeranyl reductase family protein [Bacteroidota bacterium]|nr:geranylgeranyl reductase family protein [Bacteroidota bacterium]